jgi:hypothetical protein
MSAATFEFLAMFFMVSTMVFIAGLSGWLLALFMGHARFPENHIERAIVGPIWISGAFIVAFAFGVETFWVNLLCGLATLGFVARSLWEYGLRCQERVMIDEAVQRLSTPSERTRRDPVITVIPHYASSVVDTTP